MTSKLLKVIAIIMAAICLLSYPVPVSAAQGTDGTELQVMQPQKLEIQLGGSWAGLEFSLSTDAGKYPGTIPVGEDGVLRLEIGGSEQYVLTCLSDQNTADMSTGNESGTESLAATDPEPEETTAPQTDSEREAVSNQLFGIPVKHLILFGGGLAAAVGALVCIGVQQRRRAAVNPEEDEDLYV